MQKASAAIIVLVLLASTAAGVAEPTAPIGSDASVPAWQLNDTPRAGHVDAIGGNADVLVVVLGDGRTLRSLDGANGWHTVAGLPALQKAWVEFDPSEPSRGYIAAVGGVWRTLDHGATWTHVLDIARAPRIDVSPSGAVAIGARFADTTNTVMTSHDHGDTWQDLAAPIPAGDPICGVAHGLADAQLLVMTDQRSWYSHDGGATWIETPGKGLNFAIEDRSTVWRIDMGHVERSTDGGATWTEVFPPGVGTIGAAHPDGGFYFAANVGLLLTRDGGATWDNLGHGDQVFDATGVLADPHDPDAVFVTDKFVGLARIQRDDGVSWYDGRPLDLPPAPITDAIAAPDGRTIAAGDAGLFIRDGTWRHTGAGLGVVSALRSVAASADGTHIYAGGADVTGAPAIVASRDGGRTFQATPIPGHDGTIEHIVADPNDARHSLLVITTPGTIDHVLETQDGGLSWTDTTPTGFPLTITGIAWHGASGSPIIGTDAGALALMAGVWAPIGTEPLTGIGGSPTRTVAAGTTQHWDDLGVALPLLVPVERDAARDAHDLEVAHDAVWLLGAELAKCRNGDEHCSTLTLPAEAGAIAPHDDGRVYLATQDGLYRIIYL